MFFFAFGIVLTFCFWVVVGEEPKNYSEQSRRARHKSLASNWKYFPARFSFRYRVGSKRLGIIGDNSKMEMREPKLKKESAGPLAVREKVPTGADLFSC